MHNGRWNDDWASGSAWWMALMMVAFIAVVAAVIVLVLRRNGGPSERSDIGPPQREQSPQAILAERLARGEIEPEEYSTRLSILLAAAPPP